MNQTNYFILDANAIYNYYGREKLGLSNGVKYKKDRLTRLFDSHKLFITPCVLLEVFTHFRNDINKLRDLLLFFLSKNINCLSIGEVIIDQSFIDDFVKCNDNSIRSQMINDILDKKIKTETNIAYIYCASIAGILSIFIIDDFCKKYNLPQFDAMNYKEYYNNIILAKNSFYRYKLRNDLKHGYSINKEDIALKNSYDEVLKDYILEIENVTKKIAKDKGINHNFVKNPVLPQFNSLALNRFVARYFSNNIKNIKLYRDIFANSFATKNYPQVVLNYIKLKFDVYRTGTRYKKNDGYDSLFLVAYDSIAVNSINAFQKEKKIKGLSKCTLENLHLISFDYTLLRYIHTFDEKGADITDRLLDKSIFS